MTIADVVAAARSRLGDTGVWTAGLVLTDPDGTRSFARRVEELGYRSLWTGELIGNKDIFVEAAIALSATTDLVFGTGIANIWARHPATMRSAGELAAAAWPGRLVHGLGVSHGFMVDASGQSYERPLARMRDYLALMDATECRWPPAADPVPRVLAALGPKMLELSRDHAHGAHPYLVPAEHVHRAREILGADRLLIPELKVVLGTDAAEARARARATLSSYLQMPNYVSNFRRLGFGEDDLVDGGSDRLVDALFAWGDESAIANRVAEFRQAGADHVLLDPVGNGPEEALTVLEALAPAVLTA